MSTTYKKRILFSGEASWLSTGFSTYNYETIKRIYDTGEYEIAEFGSYGASNDPKAHALPWLFYGALPLTQQEQQIYKSAPRNQFGVYKFDACVAAFQPDIVVDARDPWMFAHIEKSRFRDLYRTLLIPTVDSGPQKSEWINEVFRTADRLGTYSRYGSRELASYGLKTHGVASPGVDLSIFRPMDKDKIRSDWGLQRGLRIIGTVMRNQKRKLFPDLFESYAALRNKYKGTKSVDGSILFCHTSWPDVGWDIPHLLRVNGIQRHVVFTYKCDACSRNFISWFLTCNGNGRGRCIFCGKMAAHMPNTHSGIDKEELAELYNVMDIYVQPAICEGWGLPIAEAKACGVPTICTNYSAMEDHVENGGTLPIKVERFFTESEIMAKRALPSREDLTEKLYLLLTKPKKRERLAKKSRRVAEKLHNWDKTARTIKNIIDSIEILDRKTTWDRRGDFKILTNRPAPQNLPDEHFVVWLYRNVLDREPDEKGMSDWLTQLSKGASRKSVEDFFRNEVDSHNRFEAIRWENSLKIRGMLDNKSVVLQSNQLPGIII